MTSLTIIVTSFVVASFHHHRCRCLPKCEQSIYGAITTAIAGIGTGWQKKTKDAHFQDVTKVNQFKRKEAKSVAMSDISHTSINMSTE